MRIMQHFRFLSAILAISLASSAALAQTDNDTPAQAAARAALEQQMNQMNAEQPPASNNAVPAPAPAEPASPPPAMTEPTPQFSTNVPMTEIPMTAKTEAKLAPSGMSNTNEPPAAEIRADTNASTLSVPPTVVTVTNQADQYPVNPPMAPLPPPQAQTTAPVSTSAEPPSHPVPVPTSGSGNGWPTAVPSKEGSQPMPIVSGAGPSLGQEPRTNSVPAFAPITAPPLPISQEKQTELQNLLSQYMANQITPVQYQQQRAQILAQPN